MGFVHMFKLAAITAILLFVPVAQADEFSALKTSQFPITRIQDLARFVADQSTPACLAAACVRGDCNAVADVVAPLRAAEAWLAAYRQQLERWKKVQISQAESELENANLNQDRADELRDLQLLQDTLQTIATIATEAATWQDFLAGYGEKIFDFRESEFMKGKIRKGLKLLLSHMKRLETLIKLKDLGKYEELKLNLMKISRFVLEIIHLVQKIDDLLDKEGLKSAKTRLQITKLIKKIGDLIVDMNRRERLARIEKYMKFTLAHHQGALNALAIARQANDRIQESAEATIEIQRALRGVESCSQRICKTSIPDQPEITAGEPPHGGVEVVIEHFIANIRAAEKDLERASGRYKIEADLETSVKLTRSVISPLGEVRGGYHISNKCIPRDAHFRVFRRGNANRGKPVMKMRPMPRPDGRLKFRVTQDLSGEWTDKTGRRYTIVIDKGDIAISLANLPVKGRVRTYSGTFDGVPARPGEYELVLYSPETREYYLPTKFTVEARGSTDAPIILRNTPAGVDDLNPKLRPEIKAALLMKILSDRLAYKIKLKPKYRPDDAIILSTEFWSYRFRWDETNGKLVDESFQEKMSRRRDLHRVERD